MDDSVPSGHRGAPALDARPTFGELKAAQQKLLASQTTRNGARSSLAALHNFMGVFGKMDSDACHPLMGVEDERFAKVLLDFEAKTTVSPETVAGYRSRLRKWNATCRRMGTPSEVHGESMGDAFRKAFASHRLKNPDETAAALARSSGLPANTLRNWLEGRCGATRTPKNIKAAGILERHLRLPPGTLSSRLIPTSGGGKRREDLMAERKARLNRFSLNNVRYRPTVYPPALADFFDRYLAFKATAVPLHNAVGEPLRRRGRWRTTVDAAGSRQVATAGLFMANVATLVGWLTLPATPEGARRHVLENRHSRAQAMTDADAASIARHFVGKGLRIDEVTPAHLVDPDLLGEFIEWRKSRVGGAHDACVLIAMGLLAPGYGFLAQQVESVWHYPKLGLAPVDPARAGAASEYADRQKQWEAISARWLEQLRGLLPHVGHGGARKLPREALRPLLAHPDPMTFVARIVEGHAAGRPVGRLEPGYPGAHLLAIWHRDQLLLRMMASNPLRNRNFREMKVGTNLCRARDGSWRLRFQPSDLKNERGSAKEPYDVEVPGDLWPLVETYLRDARPILLGGAEGEAAVFVTKDGKPFTVYALSDLFWGLTGRFLEGAEDVYGFRSHAFRHLIATAWLRAHPEDYLTVAHILHDTLEVVLKNYAHNTPGDGLRRYNSWLSTRIQPLLPVDQRPSGARPSGATGADPRAHLASAADSRARSAGQAGAAAARRISPGSGGTRGAPATCHRPPR